MKSTLIFIMLVLGMYYSNSLHAQGWQWASGSTGGSEGYGIAVDPWGNTYAAGFAGLSSYFSGITLLDFGGCGTVVVKYDGAGKFLWAKSTHNGYAKPIGLATDNVGDVYLYGYYTTHHILVDTFSLNNSSADTMLFVAKFSALGDLLWAKNLCSGIGPGSITFNNGSLYITGSFNYPSVSIAGATLHNADLSGSTTDILFVKTDSSGHVLFAKSYGGPLTDEAIVSVTASGAIYLAGTSSSPSISFGGISVTNADTSFFIAKLDTACNATWVKTTQGIGKIGSFVSGIATDESENLFISGSWRETAYFPSNILAADTVSHIYLAKYAANGTFNWVAKVTSTGQLGGCGITTDKCGNIWISGGMGDQKLGAHGSHYIDIGSNRIDTPLGSEDPLFIAEWTTNGVFVKAAMLPTGGDDVSSIGADAAGNIYVSSDYWNGPYNIGSSSLNDPIQPSENIFVVKYINVNQDTTFVRKLICMADSAVLTGPPGYSFYRWDNGSNETVQTVHTPGTYKLYCMGTCGVGLLVNVFTVEYGKLDTTYGRIDTTICLNAQSVIYAPTGYLSYLWNDGSTHEADTIANPGIYWVIGVGGCTIPNIIDTFSVVFNNIDLAFTLGNDTEVCAPLLLQAPASFERYTWQDGTMQNTELATQPGIYSVTVGEQSCFNSDHILVDFPDFTQHLKDTILCREHPVQILLTANDPPGASVLWSTGSTAETILVSAEGTYWVTVTREGCTGTDTMILNEMYCTCAAIFPAAFTPNGDGQNDEFGPILDKNCNVINYTFCVYNRWGNLIFTSHNHTDKWDGRYNGVVQDAGMFFYYLEYSINTIINRHKLKGDVLLVR
jgi:gliding motility-associated-like protein